MVLQHVVFVYGTMLRGLSNHILLAQAKFLGASRTENSYSLYLDTFPKVVREEAMSPVVGEL